MKTKYKLPTRFVDTVVKGGETGMGWTVVQVETVKGHAYKNVVVLGGSEIIAVYGYDHLPFKVKDIKSIVVTHRKNYPRGFKRFFTFKETRKSRR